MQQSVLFFSPIKGNIRSDHILPQPAWEWGSSVARMVQDPGPGNDMGLNDSKFIQSSYLTEYGQNQVPSSKWGWGRGGCVPPILMFQFGAHSVIQTYVCTHACIHTFILGNVRASLYPSSEKLTKQEALKQDLLMDVTCSLVLELQPKAQDTHPLAGRQIRDTTC